MHNHSPPQNHAWHDGLEVLRGVAALAVLLFHALPVFGLMIPGTPLRLALAGWIGVDVFFVISGYVITASALRASASPGYGSRFWRARLARILPLYYLTSVVFVLLFSPGAVQQDGIFQLVTHALLIHNFFPQAATSINGVTWSLGVEMQLYVVAFFVVPLVATWPRKKLITAYAWLLCGVLAYRFFMWKILCDAGETDAVISNAVTQVPGLLESFA
jgi:peptidoglycan/LPS O-acetylase OafA/YrhL